MGHKSPMNDYAASPNRLAAGFMDSVTSFWAICGKKASQAKKKLVSNSPKSPLGRSKQLFSTISNKAIPFRRKKNSGEEFEDREDGYGDGGLWQREILRGDKCEPLDFSGVIYYDSDGKRLSEAPMRSPRRASPLPSFAYKSGEW